MSSHNESETSGRTTAALYAWWTTATRFPFNMLQRALSTWQTTVPYSSKYMKASDALPGEPAPQLRERR